jgi:hypothetical protein
MGIWLISLTLTIGATPDGDQSQQVHNHTPAALRRYSDMSDDMHAVLRAEALAKTRQQRGQAVRDMAALYREILRDPRLADSDTLKSYKAKLWSRLVRIQRELQRDIDRQDKGSGHSPEQLAAIQEATSTLASQLSLMDYSMGGPSYVFTQTGGAMGGRAVNDHGPELVELIQRTIRPDFWDTVGGPGSIFYYRQFMALVVRATSEVHGDVGGVLNGLRRAGM